MTQTQKTVEPFVGKELGTVSFTVTDDVLNDYHEGLMLPRQDHVPSMIASGPDNAYFEQSSFSNHFGHLWMRQEWELFRPLVANESYEATAHISDIYPKRDRLVVRYNVELHDGDDELMLRTRHHQSYLTEQQEGELQFRHPSAKNGGRRFVEPHGESLGPFKHTISLEMCDRFFHGDANYHTDREESKKLGFKDVVVGGRMTMSYAAHLMEDHFGEAWWTSGRMDIKFINPTWPDDTVVVRGIATGPPEEDTHRTAVVVWLARPDDTILLIANGSAEGF